MNKLYHPLSSLSFDLGKFFVTSSDLHLFCQSVQRFVYNELIYQSLQFLAWGQPVYHGVPLVSQNNRVEGLLVLK